MTDRRRIVRSDNAAFDPLSPTFRKVLPSALLGLLVGAAMAVAMPGSGIDPKTSFDARLTSSVDGSAPTPVQQRAARDFEGSGVDLAIAYDTNTGATRSLYHRTGYLTDHQAGDALDIALGFVDEHLGLLGLMATDLDDFEITDRVYSAVSGATHLYLRQRHGGIPVYNGQLHVNINRDGRIVSVNNTFLPDLAGAVEGLSTAPVIDARAAVETAARFSGLDAALAEGSPGVTRAEREGRWRTMLEAPALSHRAIEATLFWLPTGRGEARLVWRFHLYTPDLRHIYDFTVDATDGRVWTRFDGVAAASYRVFEQPVESPNHSPSPPPADGRTLVIDPQDATASPLGWHDNGSTTFTTPQGNNVHAFDDLDGNNAPPAVEPDCGAGLVCDFDSPIDFAVDDPTAYTSASVTNLFYWANLVHDVQYQYGFDEAAGNFQTNNFGNGGVGGDAVMAFGQKSGAPCPNNAFFGTGPDGNPGQMIMCLWTSSSPRRDFSFDAGVMAHEYGHGISNRLVGGPSNTSCLGNQQQPGEGLSDWWSLVYTHEVGDVGTDPRGSGTYILGQPVDGPGIRPQRYSTDPSINTYTYESISGLSVPHGVGSVWTQAAWEVYWALVDHHGFDPDLYDALGGSGNQRMKLYVNEGLKNTICSPAFTDVRDGILQAAVDNYGGEDVCRIWQAFADFGLGSDAVSSGSNGLSPTNGFAIPEACNGLLFLDGFESGDTTAWSSAVGTSP